MMAARAVPERRPNGFWTKSILGALRELGGFASIAEIAEWVAANVVLTPQETSPGTNGRANYVNSLKSKLVFLAQKGRINRIAVGRYGLPNGRKGTSNLKRSSNSKRTGDARVVRRAVKAPWNADKAKDLKRQRESLGLTQEQVGQLTGIGRRRYSWIEYPPKPVAPRPDELKSITLLFRQRRQKKGSQGSRAPMRDPARNVLVASADMETLAHELRPHFTKMQKAISTIRGILQSHADGKRLKGDELVGWMAEVYGKLLLRGVLVADSFEHDLESRGRRISVKGRKGWGSGWTQTSAIPKIEGEGCPTHLMFIHFNDDYSVDRVWLFPWKRLAASNRFLIHRVRGSHRSFMFRLNPRIDGDFVVYPPWSAGPS